MFARVLRGEHVCELKVRIEGTARGEWFVVSGYPIVIDGRVEAAVVIVRDITAQRAAEQASARSTARLERVLADIDEGFFTLDADWRFTYLNARACAMTKVPAEALLGKDIRQVFPGFVGSWRHAAFERAFTERGPTEAEGFSDIYGGSLALRIYPTEDGGLAAFGRDVTEKHRAAERLRASEERYRTLFDSANEAMFTFEFRDGRPGHFTQVNAAACALLGYSSEQLSMLGPVEVDAPEQSELGPIFARLLADGSARVERRIVRRDGRPLPVEISTHLLGGRERAEALAMVRDASEQRAMGQRLIEAEEAERGRIARELHDEIGQHLTALQLTLDLGARAPSEDLPTLLADARSLAVGLMGQVREVAFSLRPAILDDLGLLPAVSWLLERLRKHTGLALSLDAQPLAERPSPEAETAAFRIIQEALTNVARHGGARHAQVRVARLAGMLSVEIHDDGPGFDVETAEERLDSSGIRGMRRRAVLLGGWLTVHSEPGRGTRVAAHLPLHP